MPANVSSMMWNEQNGPPWHGKGVPVEGLATAAECIKKAGLDWAVVKIPLRVADESGLPVAGAMVTVRTDLPLNDRRRILGVVGEEYHPLQNWEAFGFFDKVVGHGGAIYETAGVIENGKRVWLLAKLPLKIAPAKNDEIIPYLLLANGHDGNLMIHVKFTPVRVVCQNTLAMALVQESGNRHVAIRHDRRLHKRLDDATVLLGLVDSTTRAAKNLWTRMAEKNLVEKDALKYFYSIFGGNEPDEEAIQASQEIKGLKQKAMQNFYCEENERLRIQETLWAAYNAAIWAVDWQRKTQKDRVDDLCLGEGAQLKERALEQARLILESNN